MKTFEEIKNEIEQDIAENFAKLYNSNEPLPDIIHERIEPYKKDLTDKEIRRLEHDIMFDIVFGS